MAPSRINPLFDGEVNKLCVCLLYGILRTCITTADANSTGRCIAKEWRLHISLCGQTAAWHAPDTTTIPAADLDLVATL